MGAVQLAFVFFAIAGVASFAVLRPPVAVVLCMLTGWLALPVGVYPNPPAEALPETVLPYWVIGIALPSPMLLTKAWVAPLTALAGVILFDRSRILRFRPSWADLPVALWCLSPLLAPLAGEATRPPALLSVLYLTGVWALPWLLGRLYLATPDDRRRMAGSVVLVTLAYLPVAVLEGITGPLVYGWLYHPHPYALDGADRYLGCRPLGLLEHGTQYGLWVASAALLGIARVLDGRPRPYTAIAAAAASGMALASQSVGAIALLTLALAFQATLQRLSGRWLLGPLLAAGVLGGIAYVTLLTPLRQLATQHPAGQRLVQSLRDAGRHSLAWRASLDERHLRNARPFLLTGSGRWDWWQRPDGPPARPWGLWQLALGQFGLPATAAAAAVVLWPALHLLWRLTPGTARAHPCDVALALLLVMSAADAALNSFVNLPVLLAAGGLAGSRAGQPPSASSPTPRPDPTPTRPCRSPV